jgi:hypothetical protein
MIIFVCTSGIHFDYITNKLARKLTFFLSDVYQQASNNSHCWTHRITKVIIPHRQGYIHLSIHCRYAKFTIATG